MKILLIGSGGREHALAWKIVQNPDAQLFCLPGNPGTAAIARNLPGSITDCDAILAAAHQHAIDLVVIGPEIPLAAGLADVLSTAGFLVFGPRAAAARIETSKAFAKAFMQRHNLPAARSQTFDNFDEARAYLHAQTGPDSQAAQNLVIKASGLAAGKGVFLPATLGEAEAILHDLLKAHTLGEAGEQVIIEERLTGREVSVLAFTDGHTLVLMPPAQDHKRLRDRDLGPNTGGMGAYAPSPACSPELLEEIQAAILQPAVDGLRSEGTPFTGVLYAGLMLTAAGPRLLEFNARFGDPETQVILPLLASDLVEILVACAQEQLAKVAANVRWHPGAAACIVLAAPGYPEQPQTGQPITGLDRLEPEILAFHAGTAEKSGRLVTAGGRVLGITARAGSLAAAFDRAYAGVARLHFDNIHYRRDLGRDLPAAAPPAAPARRSQSAYEAAGVSIAAGNRAVEMMKAAVRSTFTPQVLSDIGAFGGLYHAGLLQAMREPVLVASTDGVGTKVDIGAQAGRVDGLGMDIVNHCINDILVQGARPLFFLDYFASDRLDPAQVAEVVGGISAACRQAGCVLLGGETAEMPGVYARGHFDIAGTIVGVVERDAILPQPGIVPGDLLLGLAAHSPHTNGYSLIRRVFSGIPLDTVYPELGQPLAEALLVPHRCYLPLLEPLLFGAQPAPIQALAHITGGGFIDNIPRVLPPGCGAVVRRSAWQVPPLFQLIQRVGQVDPVEMYHVFNMGIGMVAIIHPADLHFVQTAIPEPTWVIGEVFAGERVKLE